MAMPALRASWRLTHRYTPCDARAARALCGDDVRAECPSRVRGVHEGLRGTLGVHVVHFPPMCLTARINQPGPPYEPYYAPHGPHEVRRAVLAGREARVDPGGAPARARRPRRRMVGRG